LQIKDEIETKRLNEGNNAEENMKGGGGGGMERR
jgi:hypothetical protein